MQFKKIVMVMLALFAITIFGCGKKSELKGTKPKTNPETEQIKKADDIPAVEDTDTEEGTAGSEDPAEENVPEDDEE
ncbi:hypothetical protein ACFL5V_07095 [Fibrobacterota bacterium]